MLKVVRALKGFAGSEPWKAVEKQYNARAEYGNFSCVCTILLLFKKEENFNVFFLQFMVV